MNALPDSIMQYIFEKILFSLQVEGIEHTASVINRSRVRVLKKIVEVGLMQNKLFFLEASLSYVLFL